MKQLHVSISTVDKKIIVSFEIKMSKNEKKDDASEYFEKELLISYLLVKPSERQEKQKELNNIKKTTNVTRTWGDRITSNTYSYTLSQDPRVALSLLRNIRSAFSGFDRFYGFELYFAGESLLKPNSPTLNSNYADLYQKTCGNICDKIVKQILKNTSLPQYDEALRAIKRFNHFMTEFGSKNYCFIFDNNEKNKKAANYYLISDLEEVLLNPHVSQLEKDSILITDLRNAISRESASQPAKSTLNQYRHKLLDLEYKARLVFYTQFCYGRFTRIGSRAMLNHEMLDPYYAKFHYAYTECDFFLAAKIKMNANGALSIINIENNTVYQKYYASGKEYHSVFAHEMEWMLNITMGLAVEPGLDWHKEIRFTKEASEILKQFGLQFSSQYVKELPQKRTQLQFFAKALENHLTDMPGHHTKIHTILDRFRSELEENNEAKRGLTL